MSPRCSRRTALRALGSCFGVALAGCSGFGDLPGAESLGDPAASEFPAGPKDPPTRPPERDADRAETYARKYERALVYNTLSDPSVDTVSVSCDAAVSAEDLWYYVVVSCRGHADGDDTHADYGRTATAYYVGDDRTARIPADEVEDADRSPADAYRADDDTENLASNRASASVRAYNFDTEERTLYLWADFLGVPGRKRIFEERYRLAPGTGLGVSHLAARRGRYRVTAALGTGPSDTRYWTLSETDPRHVVPFYLTPSGTVVGGEWVR